jgi:hypothetical protein
VLTLSQNALLHSMDPRRIECQQVLAAPALDAVLTVLEPRLVECQQRLPMLAASGQFRTRFWDMAQAAEGGWKPIEGEKDHWKPVAPPATDNWKPVPVDAPGWTWKATPSAEQNWSGGPHG